ncbi:PIN domain-containing protein [Actinoallomurus purpureus]|uniref:PIN domain-containing protein n=1 Tax=Actinoallomurus purpureus TaxID=478114 RepID=UPI0020926D6C|nr:PIN domain-containing protein [Actinoallomurus purpureus]MCO6005418.1 PIN domain-containing protein [Actinoallomurus purpureus]
MFTALLDTCVLWPSLQRNFLLSLAAEGMYRPAWSSAILEELEYHETEKLIRRGEQEDKAAARALFLIDQMRSAFDDAEIQGWEGLEGTYGLPDPDDEHVLASAVVAGAGAIVTHNTKDFPQSKVPNGIDVISPAKFAENTVELDPLQAFDAVVAIAERFGRKGPPVTTDDVLDTLVERYGMTSAVRIMRQAR